MALGGGDRAIGEVEKGFELVTKVWNIWFHIKGDILCDHIVHSIFYTLVWESYYGGQQLEFLTLTKPELLKDCTILVIVATKEARDSVLQHGLLYNHEKLKVNVIRDWDTNNLSEIHITRTLVVNNLPQKESQAIIVRTIKKLFGEDNIVGVLRTHPQTQRG